MARATRVDFPGAWYHVLNRGTERRAIFRSTRCCEKFIQLLSSLPERFGVRLHGYALMGNHYHLQLESREANLSKALHWLNVSYSVWFNRKYSRVGPLFQGRFKAILHEPTEALKINRYIHLNPVRIAALGGHETRDVAAHEITAQLARRRVDALEQYHWSSYAFFAGSRAAPAWLCTESILAFFGPGSQCELQKAFRQQLRDAAAIGRWETDWKREVKYTVFFGSAEFVAQMRKHLRGDRDQQTAVRRGALEALTWAQIVQAVSNVWNEPWEELVSARGTGARQTALFIGRIRGRLSLKELGQLAGGIHHNAVGIAIRRFTQRLQSDRTLLEKVTLVQKELEPR
jgi:REP element-mobilizing transposase RayT